MSAADDLYREIILEHFKNPRNHGALAHPSLKAEGANPFCGDELEVTVALEGERIADIRSQGKGCSISQASASMMTDAVKGKTLGEAEQLAKSFKGMMLSDAPMAFTPDTEDLESLEGVKKYPVRIKCAILSWNTLLEGLEAHRKGSSQATHVEGEEGDRPDLSAQFAAESQAPTAAAAVTASSATPAPEATANGSPEDQVKEALKAVIDPELNMNVVDLGLVYGVEIQGPKVTVTYTLTSPGCPLGPVIKGQMNTSLLRLPWVKEVNPQLVWSPPWDPHTMASEEVKLELGIW